MRNLLLCIPPRIWPSDLLKIAVQMAAEWEHSFKAQRMGSHSAFPFYLGQWFFSCVIPISLCSQRSISHYISKHHYFQEKRRKIKEKERKKKVMPSVRDKSSTWRTRMKVREGKVTGRWLFKGGIGLVLSLLKETTCSGNTWNVKIMRAEVGMLRNTQEWEVRGSRKPESVESARARGHIHRDTEPVIGGKKRTSRKLVRQVEEAKPAMKNLRGLCRRFLAGWEIGCHMGNATQPANAKRKLFFQPIYS